MKIIYPNRPFAMIQDDIYCTEICFDQNYESKQKCKDVDVFKNWKGEGYCSYCNDECNPASQTCGKWPHCY